jgi:hypothetical protein
VRRQVNIYAADRELQSRQFLHGSDPSKVAKAAARSFGNRDTTMIYVEDVVRSPAGQTRTVWQEYRVYWTKKGVLSSIKHTETTATG